MSLLNKHVVSTHTDIPVAPKQTEEVNLNQEK